MTHISNIPRANCGPFAHQRQNIEDDTFKPSLGDRFLSICAWAVGSICPAALLIIITYLLFVGLETVDAIQNVCPTDMC